MKGLRMQATLLRDQVRGRYTGLALRERALVLATGLALTGFGWDMAFNQSAAREHEGLERQLEAANAQLNVQVATANAMRAGGPGKELDALRLAVSRQRTELRDLQGKLQQRIAGFVPPDQTEKLLEDVLSHHPGMKLEAAEVLAAERISLDAPAGAPGTAKQVPNVASGTSAGTQLYRHGMRLELSGSYLDALAYLHELERMPWGLAWDRVDYQIVTHPKGRLVLELHTISDREEWIGA
jgi:MSHA biogenesis protein MshJ